MKISFVVAIYNVEKFLDKCINSLIEQDYEDYEIILVNDGSTDDSGEICKRYSLSSEKIRLINQQNQGANIARNNGLAIAKGEWVIFVDGDDYIIKDSLRTISSYLEADCDFVIFSHYIEKNGCIKKKNHKVSKLKIENQDFFELIQSTFNMTGKRKFDNRYFDVVSIWNKAYRREFLLVNNICFVENMKKLQDLTFNIQVYQNAQCAKFFDVPIYVYRINPQSVTHRYQNDIVKKFDEINSYLLNFVNRYQNKKLMSVFYERLIIHIRTCIVLYFCNSSNLDSYTDRKKNFKNFLEKDLYKIAIEEVDILKMNYTEIILFFLLKLRLFAPIDIMTKIRERLKNGKKEKDNR